MYVDNSWLIKGRPDFFISFVFVYIDHKLLIRRGIQQPISTLNSQSSHNLSLAVVSIRKFSRMSSKLTTSSSNMDGAVNSGTSKRKSLNDDFPVNSVMEITIAPANETLKGLVYCTDDISNTIVLKKSVNYTTLSSDIWVLNANSVVDKKIIVKEAPMSSDNSDGADADDVELAMPLLNVSRDSIEKREKRAIMLAQDSLKHINQKVRQYCRTSKCMGSFPTFVRHEQISGPQIYSLV